MTTLKTLALGLNRFLSRLFSDDPETIDYLNGADSLPTPESTARASLWVKH